MSTRVTFVGMLLFTFAATAAGVWLYPALPEQVASHWNVYGEVDGYIGKFWGVTMVPFIMLFVLGLWWAIPRLDPLRHNLEEFLSSYNMFFLSLNVFFLYIYGLTLAWNLGQRFNLMQFLSPALALLFAVVGVMLLHSKPNWFVGIRTPWTLSSERVWAKTHKLGAVLFEVSALLMLVGVLFPNYLLPLILVPVVFSIAATVLYSYVEFKREKR